MQTSGTFPGLSDGMSGRKPAPKPTAKAQPKPPMAVERPIANTHRRGGSAAKGQK